MNAILRIYQGDIAFIGPEIECNRLALLLKKWDSVYTRVETLFDDGLTYRSHCMSLNLQNNASTWRDMENLFERTKKQGKTVKTIKNKIRYFNHEFPKIIRKHINLLVKNEEPLGDGEYYWWDSGLTNWWLNYYFGTYDKELEAKVFLYTINDRAAEMVKNALVMERNNRGNGEEPKFVVQASEIKVHKSTQQDCYVKFEWSKLSNAGEMMNHFNFYKFSWGSEQISNARKKLRSMFPHARIECMNTHENLYQQKNDWFYIYFRWAPARFTWAQVRKAEQAVKKLVVPKLGTFRPANEPEKYSVVTLKM